VDTGFASSKKRSDKYEICPEFDARSSDGPGVSMSGDYTPPTKSPGLFQACGTPRQSRAAVPL
jgi:hypothetical protein